MMLTLGLSFLLGFVRQRMLLSNFGASNDLGIYLASSRLPDLLFQVIIAGALSSAFIPIFSDFLVKNKKEEGYRFASTLLSIGLLGFFTISIFLFIFAREFSHLAYPGFSNSQIVLMANLMRIILIGEMFFIVGNVLSAVLQSFNHFFIPGFASALYNFGIIIGIVLLTPWLGIYAPAWGVVLGAVLFVIIQIPIARKVGFIYRPSLSIYEKGIKEVFHLMWPRTVSIGIFQIGSLLTVTLISFLPDPGRIFVTFDFASLANAPILVFGQTIAQAAFPVLSREREKLEEFKQTFLTSFNQMLYLVLPVSVLLLVLRIPIVRLTYGVSRLDWPATVIMGRILAAFSIGIFAQALAYLVSRGFYALHDSKSPLIVGAITTGTMLATGAISVFFLHLGVTSIALAYSFGSILNVFLLFILLVRKIGGFDKRQLIIAAMKIFSATFFTAIALYVPIKLLDRLVFDTTKTINLLMLTGISSFAGLSLYLFLTWLFNVKEANTFILLFRKLGNWREILSRSEEVIDTPKLSQ